MAAAENRSSTRARHAAGSSWSTRPIACARSSALSRRKPGDAVGDELGRRAPVRRDDRRAAGHRLDHDEPERLRPADREQHGARPGEQLDLLVVRHVLEHLDVVAEQGFDLVLEVRELRRLAPLQDHLQGPAGLPGDADRFDRCPCRGSRARCRRGSRPCARGTVYASTSMPLCTMAAYVTSGFSAACASLTATRCTRPFDEAVEQPRFLGPRVRARCARPAAARRASPRTPVRRSRRDRARRRSRRRGGTPTARGTRRTTGSRARAARAARRRS